MKSRQLPGIEPRTPGFISSVRQDVLSSYIKRFTSAGKKDTFDGMR